MDRDRHPGIGEAARVLGTTERTLRYYEQRGLLPVPERDSGGHRRFGPDDLDAARRVLRLRRLGMGLETIGALTDGDGLALRQAMDEQSVRLAAEIEHLTALHDRVLRLTAAAAGEQRTTDSIQTLEEISMRIVLTDVVTRAGDGGTTDLGRGRRVDKTDRRIEVMGDVDEVSTAIGLALGAGHEEHADLLRSVQQQLLDLGADLASGSDDGDHLPRRVGAEQVAQLERAGAAVNAMLAPPASFVLPGSGAASAALHHARAVCRRAERHAWATPSAGEDACRYLNRLSDLLFILARSAAEGDEATWDAAR